jgi:hypothetical protein
VKHEACRKCGAPAKPDSHLERFGSHFHEDECWKYLVRELAALRTRVATLEAERRVSTLAPEDRAELEAAADAARKTPQERHQSHGDKNAFFACPCSFKLPEVIRECASTGCPQCHHKVQGRG